MELPERSRVSPRILFDEAVAGITQRPGRSVLTALGTVIGVAVLLVVLGLTSSASVQVSSQFSLVEATQVSVTQQVPVGTSVRTLQFPLDAEARAARVDLAVTAPDLSAPDADPASAAPLKVLVKAQAVVRFPH